VLRIVANCRSRAESSSGSESSLHDDPPWIQRSPRDDAEAVKDFHWDGLERQSSYSSDEHEQRTPVTRAGLEGFNPAIVGYDDDTSFPLPAESGGAGLPLHREAPFVATGYGTEGGKVGSAKIDLRSVPQAFTGTWNLVNSRESSEGSSNSFGPVGGAPIFQAWDHNALHVGNKEFLTAHMSRLSTSAPAIPAADASSIKTSATASTMPSSAYLPRRSSDSDEQKSSVAKGAHRRIQPWSVEWKSGPQRDTSGSARGLGNGSTPFTPLPNGRGTG
jgi:hypothetical protein